MKNDASGFDLRRQIHHRSRPDGLSVQNNILALNFISFDEFVPGGLNVRVKILLRRFAAALTVAGIVVTEEIHVQMVNQSAVETGQHSQVRSVAVREENRVLDVLFRVADVETRDLVAPLRLRVERVEIFRHELLVHPNSTLDVFGKKCEL